MKTAFITGCAGQDGTYLRRLLEGKGYKVVGFSNEGPCEIRGDLGNPDDVERAIEKVKPDECYNLAALSSVQQSFEKPELAMRVNAMGTLHLLEAIRKHSPKTRFYQASSSEMFGKVQEVPQKETTPFHPRSPYAISKLTAHLLTQLYRESYGLYCCSGILFNHESPLRPQGFVTRKIIDGAIAIARGEQEEIVLGNLNAKRDWGYAPEYVEAIHLMLQQKTPEDFVIATGESRTIREFVTEAFRCNDITLHWEGEGVHEIGKDAEGIVRVRVSAEFFRPVEVDEVQGDASKAKRLLGWTPHTRFVDLIRILVEEAAKNPRKDL